VLQLPVVQQSTSHAQPARDTSADAALIVH
jgi:hypothetical protein